MSVGTHLCNRHLETLILQMAGSHREMLDHRLTVSIGVAGVLEEASDLPYLIQADQALYAGKHGGRNRVVMGHEGKVET